MVKNHQDLTEVLSLLHSRVIIRIKYSLVLMDSRSGSFNYHTGMVENPEQLRTFQNAIMNLERSEVEYTVVAIGEVICFFDDNITISINPVFHPSEDRYKDLLYINNKLCYMPLAISELLELWRKPK